MIEPVRGRMSASAPTDVAIIGAGPAGLAAAAMLRSRGIGYRLLERGVRWGQSWIDCYDSLRLHTGKHMSHLPGLRFGRSVPIFPTRTEFLAYLDRYVEHHRLKIETGSNVRAVRREARSWRVEVEDGDAVHARALVVATGIMANPLVPDFAGYDAYEGRVLHSVAYRNAAPFAGHRVLVVGVGNSGAEIASELAASGTHVSIAVRSGANVVPFTLLGVPIQYHAALVQRLPPAARALVVRAVGGITRLRRGPPVLPVPAAGPLDSVPLIGFHLVDRIRAGQVAMRPGISRFTRSGVRFMDGSEEDFDDVILATGFRAALQPLGGLVETDQRGFARRHDRIRSAGHPDLFFVGQNYDATGGLANIRHDARLLADAVAAAIQAAPDRRSP
jgi:cation diffusion facilitator CzcD-associated flavoprotein CzcO